MTFTTFCATSASSASSRFTQAVQMAAIELFSAPARQNLHTPCAITCVYSAATSAGEMPDPLDEVMRIWPSQAAVQLSILIAEAQVILKF